MGGPLVIGGMLEGDCRTLASLSLLPDHEVNSFALPHAPALICCFTTEPKKWGEFFLDQNFQNNKPK